MSWRAECDVCNWRSVKFDTKKFAEMEMREHQDDEDCIFAEVIKA